MFAESVGNTPQGHARSYYSRLDDGQCQARAGFQAAQDAHLPRSRLPGQNQVSQRPSRAPAVPTLRGPGKEHFGRLSRPFKDTNDTLLLEGEEAFRARGEGLWENEATGKADQILSIVQRLR